MGKYNKVTLLSRISDFINRVAPFDSDPLIQKTEDNIIRDDVVDSMVSEIPASASINNPAASFTVDFDAVEDHLIDTTSSIPNDFTITLDNLNGNVTGKISVTKKTGQTFAFSNATILGANDTIGQDGLISLAFIVFIIDGTYYAIRSYDRLVQGANIADDSISTSKLIDDIITVSKMGNAITSGISFTWLSGGSQITSQAGICQLVGTITPVAGPSLPLTIGTLPTFRPVRQSNYLITPNDGAGVPLDITIQTNGDVIVNNASTTDTYDLSQIMFIAK